MGCNKAASTLRLKIQGGRRQGNAEGCPGEQGPCGLSDGEHEHEPPAALSCGSPPVSPCAPVVI
eukprot:1142426-Pelagomonas_calceolata.AAC.3